LTQQLPAHLQTYQVPDIGATLSQNLGSSMPPHVSIGGNRFTLVDAANNEIPVPTFDPKLGVYLDACIVDVNDVMSRVYFAGQYDPNAEGVRPDCFSDNGVGPSVSANSPQSPTCAACPQALWTKVNNQGNKVPWCTQKQKMALLIPGMSTLFLLALPPGSHGLLREYVNLCKGNGVNIANLVTRISFASQGVLQFQAVSYIDEPTAQLRQAAYIEKKTDDLVGRNDVARSADAAIGARIPYTSTREPTPNTTGQAPLLTTQPGSTIQVQQPVPFAHPASGTTPTQLFAPSTQPAAAQQTAASPSEGAPTTRRRRRTAAEMAAAQQPPASGQATPAPAVAPQAPFPHPGQQVQQPQQPQFPASQQPGALPGQTDMGFGMAQGTPAGADPAISGMLDSFFGKQG
jgi:hypothetical protein